MQSNKSQSTIHSLVDGLEPVRPVSAAGGIGGAMLASLVAVLLSVYGLGLRGDLALGHLDPMFLLPSGLFLMLALATIWTVVQMGRPRVGGHRSGWQWACATAALLPLSALIVELGKLASGGEAYLDSYGITCLGTGVSLGLLVGIVLTLWLRKGAPTSPVRAGMLIGIAAGSAGVFATSLHCSINDIAHIGFWHSLVVVVSGLIGRFVIPPVIRW